MINSIFSSSSASAFSLAEFFTASAVSVILGLVIMLFHSYRNRTSSKNFLMTLVILPVVVQAVIMVVNGNIGTGVAVAGAFSLVRFRSVPGNARDICSIFLAMAAGLAAGTGYIGLAILLVIIVGAVSMIFTLTCLDEDPENMKELRITIPESLDYSGAFDDILDSYTSEYSLDQVKTTNMGSLYKLTYRIRLSDIRYEKEMIDALRCRNGNLDISCGRIPENRKEKL